MTSLSGRTAVVTGGTDGIGAATALRLRQHGANVIIVGRSQTKADALVAKAAAQQAPGSLHPIVADFSLMTNVQSTVRQIAERTESIDILVHAVGILITRAEHTSEGIEKDFAVSYLARFVFLESASAAGLLHSGTRMINIAASSPKVPRYAQLDFSDLDKVERRVGMKSHGQAQLANDLLTAQAGNRYGITAVGYGPGSVHTSIRREVPKILQTIMKPFFYLTTRNPDQVADQLVDIITDPDVPAGAANFYNRHGRFPTADYIADPGRQQAMLKTSLVLAEKARSYRSPDQ